MYDARVCESCFFLLFLIFSKSCFFKVFFLVIFHFFQKRKVFRNIFSKKSKVQPTADIPPQTTDPTAVTPPHSFMNFIIYELNICWNMKITLETYSGSTAKLHLQRTIPATTTQLLGLFSEETRDHVILPAPPRRQRPRLGKDRSQSLLFRRLPYCSPTAGAHSVQFL